MRRFNKIELIRKMGWSKDDLLELFREVVEIAFSGNFQVCTKTKEETIDEFFISLGFKQSYSGTIFLKTMLVHCLEENNPDLHFKMELYQPIIEETGVKYDDIRYRIRKAIYGAFKEPTEFGQKLFSHSIEKRGYPTIKEFILEAYDYLKKILPEDE